MMASVYSSPCKEAQKIVVPVRRCCRSWPAVSGRSFSAAPPAASVRPIVPDASANMMVFWLSGRGRRHGKVG